MGEEDAPAVVALVTVSSVAPAFVAPPLAVPLVAPLVFVAPLPFVVALVVAGEVPPVVPVVLSPAEVGVGIPCVEGSGLHPRAQHIANRVGGKRERVRGSGMSQREQIMETGD